MMSIQIWTKIIITLEKVSIGEWQGEKDKRQLVMLCNIDGSEQRIGYVHTYECFQHTNNILPKILPIVYRVQLKKGNEGISITSVFILYTCKDILVCYMLLEHAI